MIIIEPDKHFTITHNRIPPALTRMSQSTRKPVPLGKV